MTEQLTDEDRAQVRADEFEGQTLTPKLVRIIDAHAADLAGLVAQLEAAKAERDALDVAGQANVRDWRAQVAELQRELTESEGFRSAMRGELDKFKGAAKSACASEMRDQLKHQGACNTQEDDLERWAFSFDAVQALRIEAESQVAELTRELHAVRTVNAAQRGRIGYLEGCREELTREREEARSEAKRCAEGWDSTVPKQRALESEVTRLQSELDAERARNAQLIHDAHPSALVGEVTRLQRELSAANQRGTELLARCGELTRELAAAEAKATGWEQASNRFQDELAESEADKVKLYAEARGLREALAAERSECNHRRVRAESAKARVR